MLRDWASTGSCESRLSLEARWRDRFPASAPVQAASSVLKVREVNEGSEGTPSASIEGRLLPSPPSPVDFFLDRKRFIVVAALAGSRYTLWPHDRRWWTPNRPIFDGRRRQRAPWSTSSQYRASLMFSKECFSRRRYCCKSVVSRGAVQVNELRCLMSTVSSLAWQHNAGDTRYSPTLLPSA